MKRKRKDQGTRKKKDKKKETEDVKSRKKGQAAETKATRTSSASQASTHKQSDPRDSHTSEERGNKPGGQSSPITDHTPDMTLSETHNRGTGKMDAEVQTLFSCTEQSTQTDSVSQITQSTQTESDVSETTQQIQVPTQTKLEQANKERKTTSQECDMYHTSALPTLVKKPSPVRSPTGPPVFTCHVYAVLEKKFKFNKDCDVLLLFHSDKHFMKLDITNFMDMGKQGCLVEATVSVPENMRGHNLEYCYAVQQQQKKIMEIAKRWIQIPFEKKEKEMHLYEGFIHRAESAWSVGEFWKRLTGLGGKKISDDWNNSARILLDTVFQQWQPSNQETTETFVDHLSHYQWGFNFASQRVAYSQDLFAPHVKVSEFIVANLLRILKEDSEEESSKSSAVRNPLLLAISVFQVCIACNVNLDVKGWARLCQLVSSGTALDNRNLEEFKQKMKSPLHSLIGLMNHCAQMLVSEVVLLVPLLHALRQPRAHAGTLGPAMEEQDWAGLEDVKYHTFRERLRDCSDKRRMVLKLIQQKTPLMKEKPRILTSWLSMVAFEDVSGFAQLSEIVPKLLIQSLMYRLKEFVLAVNDNRAKKNIQAASFLQCSMSIHRSTCLMSRLVQSYDAAVLSFQLVLKVAEIQYAALSKGGEEKAQEQTQILKNLSSIQQEFSLWRDGLLSNPLLKNKSTLSYPREIEMWGALFGLECSIPAVSEQWKAAVETDLKKRICQTGDVSKVMLCCLQSSAEAIDKSHAGVQMCFQELCQSAIKTICQVGKERDLMHALCSCSKSIPSLVLSSIIVESAARLKEDRVAQLLEPWSAIHFLLSGGNWNEWKVNNEAKQVMQSCQSNFSTLVNSLCQGSIHLSDLQTTLKYADNFKKLFTQYKKNCKVENISIDAEGLLTQRRKDLKAFTEQREHIGTLIKMMASVSERICVSEISILEQQYKSDQQGVSLNKLVTAQPCYCKVDLVELTSAVVLCYSCDLKVQNMAREMHEVRESNLLLSSWNETATEETSMILDSTPVSMDLTQVYDYIWKPCLTAFYQLGLRIAQGTVNFKDLDKALKGCEDKGDGTQMKKELKLYASKLENFQGLEENWVEVRLDQIQQYRQLCHVADSASAILRIRDKLNLQGNFEHISSLTQLREDSFKQRGTLTSLSDDLISAGKRLPETRLHTDCLEQFLKNYTLVKWVKANLKSLSDLKVFVDLASISAGENDAEIDRLASFHDAVMGYSPFLYSLATNAGFEEFITCAEQVWETLKRDEKLPEKLRDSCRWLDWLKGLRETHGSVEQSSLSLASAINSQGVYHVGWSADPTGKRCLGKLLHVKIKKDKEEKSYSLDELLELQNKLMLMSSKGEHGKEQVNKFTQVFEGVQRMGAILLKLHSSGNMLFRDWKALVKCNPEVQPCIQVRFSLLQKEVVYHGDVTDQLQELCRSMEACHKDWQAFLSEMRSRHHALNHYTSEQLVFLCQTIHSTCIKKMSVPSQIWHLLTPIKPGCTLKDIREAFAKASELMGLQLQYDTPVVPESKGTSDLLLSESEEEVENFLELPEVGHEMLETELYPSPQVQDDIMESIIVESVEDLWHCFKENMPRYLQQHMDIRTLACFLSCLSAVNQQQIKRKLPSALQAGRPNLVLCPVAEVLNTVLCFYMESPEQALPSSDEVLMCQEETSQEEVEIFLRRCLGRGTAGGEQKIYSLVNPHLLSYDVSVALGEFFEVFERSAGSHYCLVMVCPVNHQHRYVPSFFSNYKVQAGLCVCTETTKKYLCHHFSVPSWLSGHADVYPDGLCVWIISSERPAVGKSLYIKRLFERFQNEFETVEYMRISLIEPQVDLDAFVQTLSKRLEPLREQDPVLLHIDTAAVRFGLEEFLFKLLILGCLSDGEGKLWRRNAAHLVAVEALHPRPTHHNQSENKDAKQGLLHALPTIFCRPPKEVKYLELTFRKKKYTSLDPLMDKQEFESESIQRPYQYLRRFIIGENLDRFKYHTGSKEGDPVDCLHHLLSNCGLKDPSWAELKHFTWFLNLQLKDCENSLFCDADFLADQLRGFKDFIVKFMILMARDFASPSMDISDQSPALIREADEEDDLLSRLTIRKKWENESHPYIFFNADHVSMSFLGFHVMRGHAGTFDAVDPQSNKMLFRNVMSAELFEGLERQRISLREDFDSLPREDKIQRISFVVGAKKGCVKGQFDPDPTYELTADNVMKMLAIHMRFRCEIPVIIMGETGCGKTRLVRFLCDLQREGRNVENMKLVKVHGGTTANTIYQRVREAKELAEYNRQKYKLDTILFFDEANTTEAIFAIKEVLCDKTVEGFPLGTNTGLKIIAACNPYRRHTLEMVQRLEQAGLGYRVKATETEDRLGNVPMRQLVYRVHPLPPSMIPLVWDFGQLSNAAELSYIRQIVQKQAREHNLPREYNRVISDVLATSQMFMRSQKNECSFVSLRDVERAMRVLLWFYHHRDNLFPDCQELDTVHMTLKCLALAVGVCYYPSLVSKDLYLMAISRCFPEPFNSQERLEHEISSCQDFFLENIQTRETIAKNLALKENVFLMVVCIELRIPLFLVGKPGSSKSLAKTVVADAMQRQASHGDLFRKLKEVHMVSFQCSPHSSPEGIIGTFRNCARFQKDKNMDEYVSVVVLDEIGLAEDSPQMPLKTLHPLLEDGCIDNERPDPHMKVGFVGISNWALDPAKMNRGIFVSRWDPTKDELVETAKGICSSSNSVLSRMKHFLPGLAKGFLNICEEVQNQFFGLRDFYSLVKMIFAIVKNNSNKEPSDSELAEAILRNFSGQPGNFDPLKYFRGLFQNPGEVSIPRTLQMVEQNLDWHDNKESRYLLLLTTNNAALHIIQQRVFSKGSYAHPEIVFGSGFPKDQEYAQICRNVSRVKTCMETGRMVVLLNLQNLYESLYDALNQYYVYFSGQQYVDLGLGSHRVKCRVHKDFRLVVVEDQERVYKQFPVPLINRLEKYRVDRSTDLTSWQHRVLEKLEEWVRQFSQHPGSSTADFGLSDVFIGFHGDACASALLQALEERELQTHKKGEKYNKTEDEDVSAVETMTENETEVHREREGMDFHEMESDDGRDRIIPKSSTQPEEDQRSIPEEAVEGHVSVEGTDSDENCEVPDSNNTIREDSVPVEMEADQDVMETVGSSNSDNIEEEVFERAKSYLLGCATPDSMLRLKYSDLANQEKERLREMYFNQQHHCSLRDFLDHHLNKTEDSSRFIEITTFSSLLTKADERILAQAVGLSTTRFLLLSLHQFDTEASFCAKIRNFLKAAGLSLHILLIQMDIEESQCSNELIASAKYCTMNELISAGSVELNCYVVFITKLSRIASGGHYIGFQGGVWLSVHIDDLRDSEDMSLDLSAFCGTPFSKLLSQPAQLEVMDTEDTAISAPEGQRGRSTHLDSLSLVRSCIQKAVALLRDPDKVAPRSMERIRILFVLLGDGLGRTGAHFQEALLSRLVAALVLKEEQMFDPGDWVNREAKKCQALQEGGTLRHTLWRCLQSTLMPVLAWILEALDRCSNLDLLCSAGLSEGLVGFWLDVFKDKQLLDVAVPHNSGVSEQEINVQHHLWVGEEARPCAAPFSWLVRMFCLRLWEESEFVPGTQDSSTERVRQFMSTVSASRLGNHMKKLTDQDRLELGRRYLSDFVLLSFKITCEKQNWVFTTAVISCVSELQQAMNVTPDLSPAWILAAIHHYAPRLDTLTHILQLQSHVIPMILEQRSQTQPPELREDILALGICVEETQLLPLTSPQECQSFLKRVELLQPCLGRVLGHNYSTLCSPGCLKSLKTIKGIWSGLLVIAAFIEHVMTGVKQSEVKLEALTLKHCNQLKKLMEESPDLKSKEALEQLIRILNDYHDESISRELRFGVKCEVCLSDFSKPCMLPCEHVFCTACLRRSLQRPETHCCPKCRTVLPPDFQPSVSPAVLSALAQHGEVKRRCNSFFLEVVSHFCLSEGQSLQEEAVELLFSLLISAQGGVYKTRELTPFLECVDQSPVVRSVLPKLLLQHSFKQVKGHIQDYLQSLEKHVLDQEDRTELYLLFVNCFQDSLHCGVESGSPEAGKPQKRVQEDISFLSRFARKQTPSINQEPAEFLLCIARLKTCLSTAASLIHRVNSQTHGKCLRWWIMASEYLGQVKAVFEYSANDWHRVYLLRALNKQAGTQCVQALISSTSFAWIFPKEVIRFQKLIPGEVDRFLCCGPVYTALRNAIGQVLLEKRTDALKTALQVRNAGDSGTILLPLALFRQITCRLVSSDQHLEPQDTKILEDFLKKHVKGDLCIALLSNRIGGLESHLRISGSMTAQRRILLELLLHASSVFYSEHRLLLELQRIATQPHSMRGAFLPTMPDDHSSEAQQWLTERRLTRYKCPNGHICFVGECGKTMEESTCPDCKAPIGGLNHRPVHGFTQVMGNIGDQTRPGHILGDARRRTEAPNRQLSLAQSSVLRLLTHLAMLQGTIHNLQVIREMIQPDVLDVQEFLLRHLEKDMEALMKTLNCNVDETATIIHLILSSSTGFTAGRGQRADLSSRQSREQWEKLISDSLLNPVIKDLQNKLTRAQEMIRADDRLTDSPLMKLLHTDPRPTIPLPSDCPTHQSTFWNVPDTLTVERLSQTIDQNQKGKSASLLSLFLKKVQGVRFLAHLPELASLQADLTKLVPPNTDTATQTIATVLQSIPAGQQRRVLQERVRIFIDVWNHLRMEVASSDLGVDIELCQKEVTVDSSGQYLSLSQRGPGSCLLVLIEFLSQTHNSLIREARKFSKQEDSEYSLPVGALSESQLVLCHPERELLPLVLAHCHYTLEKGKQTHSSYDLQAVQRELYRRFLAGKPIIKADKDKYLIRHHQDFSIVLAEVIAKIPQEPLKGSVRSAMRTVLRSFTDVCDAVFVVEIGLRLLGKTGGDPSTPFLIYLRDGLEMKQQISGNVAKALEGSRLCHSTAVWQLLTCWKSEVMLKKEQDPFPRLSKEFREKLTSEERRRVKDFLGETDVDLFALELHEILQLKTSSTAEDGYHCTWDIRSTLESYLEQKNIPCLPAVDCLSEEITLHKAADTWRMAVEFKK
ncbi:E3 ubiquitin-protein ligase rnf213-beta [Chanos chanos]|uniref:RING-type E3 ubiquitin transferase n=1 Tax=Chanos chanos TaxID=29144 RepID=A0A6J2VCZ9_CHACN|nr:E3 ubiquitin-protein ligase rnf213-beta-like [Chanos chanos]